jgi:hypothetical protein
MERSTVQSCLAAPSLSTQRPCKISINRRWRLIVAFSHFSYFSRNRAGKAVSADTKLAQPFVLCPRARRLSGARRELASPNRRKRPLAALGRPIGAEMPRRPGAPTPISTEGAGELHLARCPALGFEQTQRCDDNTQALRAPSSDVQPVRAVEKFHSARRVGVTGSRHGIDDDRGFLTLNLSTVPMRAPGMRS